MAFSDAYLKYTYPHFGPYYLYNENQFKTFKRYTDKRSILDVYEETDEYEANEDFQNTLQINPTDGMIKSS
jgi:hypothetical protein